MEVSRRFLTLGDTMCLNEVMSAHNSDAYWERGRQGSGYEKFDLKLFSDLPELSQLIKRTLTQIDWRNERQSWDAWIIHYRLGDFVAPHRDDVPYGLRHKRLNAIIRQSYTGGDFLVDGRYVPLSDRDAVMFYPGEVTHEVTPVTAGLRLVFSAGIVV